MVPASVAIDLVGSTPTFIGWQGRHFQGNPRFLWLRLRGRVCTSEGACTDIQFEFAVTISVDLWSELGASLFLRILGRPTRVHISDGFVNVVCLLLVTQMDGEMQSPPAVAPKKLRPARESKEITIEELRKLAGGDGASVARARFTGEGGFSLN